MKEALIAKCLRIMMLIENSLDEIVALFAWRTSAVLRTVAGPSCEQKLPAERPSNVLSILRPKKSASRPLDPADGRKAKRCPSSDVAFPPWHFPLSTTQIHSDRKRFRCS